jgi:DNA-binding NarL/FixJ family response regulator
VPREVQLPDAEAQRYNLRHILRKDGAGSWTAVAADLMYDSDGRYPDAFGLVADVAKRNRRERLDDDCNRVLDMLARNEPLDDILAQLVHTVERQFPGMRCAVVIPDGAVHHQVAPSLPPRLVEEVDRLPIELATGFCGSASSRDAAVVVCDVAAGPSWEACRAAALAHELRACWLIPIVCPGNCVPGTFAMYGPVLRYPDRADVHLLARLRRLAAIAVAHARLQRDLAERERRLYGLVGRLQPAQEPAAASLGPLTRREREVLQFLAGGKTNREIARELTLSVCTVKTHVEHIIAKLAVSDRTQAAVRAVELGLLTGSPP